MCTNANVDVAINVLAIGAVAMMAPYDYWSLSYLGSDVGLFLGGVVAYWLSSQDFSFISPMCKGAFCLHCPAWPLTTTPNNEGRLHAEELPARKAKRAARPAKDRTARPAKEKKKSGTSASDGTPLSTRESDALRCRGALQNASLRNFVMEHIQAASRDDRRDIRVLAAKQFVCGETDAEKQKEAKQFLAELSSVCKELGLSSEEANDTQSAFSKAAMHRVDAPRHECAAVKAGKLLAASADFPRSIPEEEGKGYTSSDVSKEKLPTVVKLLFCIIVAGNLCLLFCAIAAFGALMLHFRLKAPEDYPTESGGAFQHTRPAVRSLDRVDAGSDDILPTVLESGDAVHPEQQQELQFNVNDNVLLMEKYASQRDLCGTMRTFRLIQQSVESMSSAMYNIVLQAYINCGNVQAAEDWMEDAMEAKMADSLSFSILIKALVQARALCKAKDCLKDMRRAGLQPCTATFDEVLNGLVQDGRCDESFNLLDDMHAWGVPASAVTIQTITKLVNDSRSIDQRCERIRQILQKCNFAEVCTSPSSNLPVALPRLAAVIYNAEDDAPAPCEHEFEVTGSLAQIKAVRRTLKQHGFLDKNESDARPLDGHWETDYRLTVVIEGKVVRWSGQRASTLHYTAEDQTSCKLAISGETAQGKVMSPPTAPDVRKELMWDNGDIWSSYDGRVIGQDTLFSQTMTKTLRHEAQDEFYRARSSAILNCVSKQALGVPSILEQNILQFLGNDLYYVRVQYSSKWNPSHVGEDELPLFDADADICVSISQRHPQVGLRHCWADRDMDSLGQRTLVNGVEVDEECFTRHIGAVRWA